MKKEYEKPIAEQVSIESAEEFAVGTSGITGGYD